MGNLIYLDDGWKDGIAGICHCGWSPDHPRITMVEHERWWHPRWELGLPVPGFAADGEIAMVPSCQYGRGARIAFTMARVAQLEGRYKSLAFPVPRPDMEESVEWFDARVIVYLAIAEGRSVGFVSVAYVVEGETCRIVGDELEPTSEFACAPRPSVGLIFVSKSWRRKGIGTRLVERIAADANLKPGQLIWQPPLTRDGLALARRFLPEGVIYVG